MTKAFREPRASIFLYAVLFATLSASAASAQTTAISYQGRLTDGRSPANGSYDIQFKLFDAATEGTQIGATITRATVPAANGVFTVQLDFGTSAFSGGGRFLEISLRPAGGAGPYSKLATRQQIVSAPYAIQTVNVRQWGGADANQEEYIKNTKTQQEDANFNISGDGTVGGHLTASSLKTSGDGTIAGNLNAGNLKTSGDGDVGTNLSAGNLKVYGNSLLLGQVGVGTSNPLSNLTVQTPKENYGLLHTDGNVVFGTWIGAGASGGDSGWFGTKSNHPLRFFTNNGSASMTINTSGNVGIGTTTPEARLDVRGGRDVAVFGASDNNSGLYGLSSVAHTTEYSGVLGRSTGEGGIGVIGEANKGNAYGLFGTSRDGTGVRGESAAAHTTTNPGVYGTSTGDGGIGVIGEANTVNAWGVAGRSASGTGVYGESKTGFAMKAAGNTTQDLNAGGWVKAMVVVNYGANPWLVRCFNSQATGATVYTRPCGITVSNPSLGVWYLDFGFDVTQRFATVTPHFTDWCGIPDCRAQHDDQLAAQLRYQGTRIDVRIFYTDSGRQTNAPFTLIVY